MKVFDYCCLVLLSPILAPVLTVRFLVRRAMWAVGDLEYRTKQRKRLKRRR